MTNPKDDQVVPWPEDPDAPDPTVIIPGWSELETALRKRTPDEPEPQPAEHVLVVYAGTHLGRVFPLVPGVNVIGRSPGVDLPLPDDEVSRTHAWVTLRGAPGHEVMLEDCGSTNGTFLNDQRVTGATPMVAGDRIALGNHVLKLVAMDPLERAFYAVLLDQSTRDPLTGLNNRRSTLEELQHRFDLSQRHERPLGVIMCDLDHFKLINDTLGHGAGDLVLEEFGRRVKNNLRTTDLAGRIGGEEFLLVLPETDMEGALLLANRLRAATGEVLFDLLPENLRVTCSLGVAQRTAEDRDGGALMARADGALYAAKRGGRDRVCSDPPGY
ncbi:MAG: GGDEF domain-containing protein [Holophaga sp.]|nr:GGDEF domain-containing protein [Holophaga sp.]